MGKIHYIHVFKINRASPQVRGLDSAICHVEFILTLPGNWGDSVSFGALSKGNINSFTTAGGFRNWDQESTEVKIPPSHRSGGGELPVSHKVCI